MPSLPRSHEQWGTLSYRQLANEAYKGIGGCWRKQWLLRLLAIFGIPVIELPGIRTTATLVQAGIKLSIE